MKKKEWVYREILYKTMERGERFFTQKGIAERCGMSIGNVNKALIPLEEMNAIEKKPKGFRVINVKKALLYWASIRRLGADRKAQINVRKTVAEIEREMPPVKFTAYSGYKLRFGEAPSDYSEVVVYGDEDEIKRRFKTSTGRPNIIVLKPDPHLSKFKEVPLAQIFVDLWNLDTWYAEEFLKALERRIDALSR